MATILSHDFVRPKCSIVWPQRGQFERGLLLDVKMAGPCCINVMAPDIWIVKSVDKTVRRYVQQEATEGMTEHAWLCHCIATCWPCKRKLRFGDQMENKICDVTAIQYSLMVLSQKYPSVSRLLHNFREVAQASSVWIQCDKFQNGFGRYSEIEGGVW
jgi:hypothetical protein